MPSGLFRSFVCTALLLLSIPGAASQEEIIEPFRVAIQADCGAGFGVVEVEISVHTDGRKHIVKSILLRRDASVIPVPGAAFAGLPAPLPGTLQLRRERGYDRYPWLYIIYNFDHTDPDGRQNPRQVYIAWQNGKFVYRALKYRGKNGQWVFERKNL